MKKLIIGVSILVGVKQLAARTREPKEPVASNVINCSRDKQFVCKILPNADYSYTERVCHCEPSETAKSVSKKKRKKS